jgi:hypothetical protein
VLTPLKLPPGVARRGTTYESRGRYFNTQLVRWHEGVMKAFDGWSVLQRTSSVDVSAAISDDGGVFTNETTDANDVGADDVVLIPVTPAINDAFYVGYAFRFSELSITIGTTNMANNEVVWEYHNGTAWTALTNVSDNTHGFQVTGVSTVTWNLPVDWAKATVNSQGPFYYVRARSTLAGTGSSLGTQIQVGRGPVDLDEPIRGLFAWKANDSTPHLFLGTPTKAYVYAAGVLTDITPVGFTVGGAHAVLTSGNYGAGGYGSGAYGTGDLAQSNVTEANTWQVDNFGEDLVFNAYSDGKIYYWDKSVGGVATVITNAPTSCKGVVVTPDRFIMALGASGEGRKVAWPDRENTTVWTTSVANEAGNFTLPGKGHCVAAMRGNKETLIWTDVDLFAARPTNNALIFGFPKVGSNCAPISRRAMMVFDGQAAWMGKRSFYVYDGFARPVSSDVSDYVFNDMNLIQVSKIHCEHRADYGEVIWYYPSGASNECDRYVAYNYRGNFWFIGELERTAAADRDAFANPLAADAGGVVYLMEEGSSYMDPNGDELTPFAETGPLEIAEGGVVAELLDLYPDENTLGGLQLTVFAAQYPTAVEEEYGPFTLANPTSIRVSGRQLRFRWEQLTPNWRLGTPRLLVEGTDER